MRIQQTLCQTATAGCRYSRRNHSALNLLNSSSYVASCAPSTRAHYGTVSLTQVAHSENDTTPTAVEPPTELESLEEVWSHVADETEDAVLATHARRDPQEPSRKGTQKHSKPPSSAPSSSSQPNKAEAYLASLHAAGLQPTLGDLERCRPPGHADPDTPQFEKDYNNLLDTLSRAFSKEQLRNFLEQWDRDCAWCRHHRRKHQYAEWIIEKMWGWPSLKEVARAQRDRTEISTKTFPVSPSELFLILGKDGADLLEMSLAYNVHISLASNPLALRVEGVHNALNRLTEHLASVRQRIVSEEYRLHSNTSLSSDMIQRISRLSGAFVENVGLDGLLRIQAKYERNIDVAKRLATRTIHESHQQLQSSRLAYLPSAQLVFSAPVTMFPRTYSLYPFLSPRSLPWTMNTGGAFRARRVGEWLSHNSENIEATGGLAGGNGRIISASQDSVDLKGALLSGLGRPSAGSIASTRVVKAVVGHMLVTPSSGQRPSLVPPLRGNHPFGKILRWMADQSVQSAFVPSLPAPLADTSPSQQRIVHRLSYRTMPTGHHTEDSFERAAPRINKIMRVEVALAQAGKATSASRGDTAQIKGTPSEDSETGSREDLEDDAVMPDLVFAPRYLLGLESQVDLMLPDRPMDLQLSAMECNAVEPGREPPEIQSYLADLKAFLRVEMDGRQPDPPLTFQYDGDTFILHTSASVRQSVELMDHPGESPENPELPAIKVTSESILDLEGNQKSTLCEITCEDPTSKEAWQHFFSSCDRLTSMTYQPRNTLKVEQPDNDNMI